MRLRLLNASMQHENQKFFIFPDQIEVRPMVNAYIGKLKRNCCLYADSQSNHREIVSKSNGFKMTQKSKSLAEIMVRVDDRSS